ncbi:MAG: histidine phosphatase family protein [Candidatus Eisenbacteria bacterium]
MPLLLDLLRHGDALPAADGGDDARRLSPRGERDLERLALHLAGLRWRPDRAFTSPMVRARDSARIVLRRAAPDLVAAVMDALRPDGEPAGIVAALVDGGLTEGHLLLVGHQPLLGELARSLTGGETPGFAPGDLLRVEFAADLAAGAGRSRWRVRPQDCA